MNPKFGPKISVWVPFVNRTLNGSRFETRIHPWLIVTRIDGILAEWSKAVRSGRIPFSWARVRISQISRLFFCAP